MNYDETKYKVWTWKHPLMLHWIINPGLVVNELVLGQRIPKVILIERSSNKSFAESQLVPCPHCETLHSVLKWTPQNKTAFGNWFGLYCDNCGNIIPCLTNLTSYLILWLTLPFWFWFKDSLKEKWLDKQKEKFSKPLNLSYPQRKNQWLRAGLFFGFFMYIFAVVLFPLIMGESLTQRGLLIGVLIWGIAGFLFGFTMKILYRKKQTENLAVQQPE